MAYASDFGHKGWVGGTIYYSFDFIGPWRFQASDRLKDPDGIVRMGTLNAYWQERFEAAMDEWEAIANVRFVETTRLNADLFIGWKRLLTPVGRAGDAWGLDLDRDGWFEHNNNEGFVVRMDPDDTDIFFRIAVHELGHVLGLGHIEHTPSIMASHPQVETPTAYDIHVIQTLYGPPGSDLLGTDGADRLTGTAGADEIYGRNGADTIEGMGGADTLFGNIGTDWLDGGSGDDLIFAGQNAGPLRVASDGNLRHLDGIDYLWGGAGNDTLCGQYGSDYLDGGDGDDALFGGQNRDDLRGGWGDDVLAGNRGDDWLQGGAGSDRFYFGHDSGKDIIVERLERIDGGSRDLIYIQADVNGSGIHTADDVLARIRDNLRGEAVIDLGAGNSITMLEHGTAWFTASDFIIY